MPASTTFTRDVEFGDCDPGGHRLLPELLALDGRGVAVVLHAVRRAAVARAGEDARHRRHAAARDPHQVHQGRDLRRELAVATHVEEWRAKVFMQLHRVTRARRRRPDLRRPRGARLRQPRRRRSRPLARDAGARRHPGAVLLNRFTSHDQETLHEHARRLASAAALRRARRRRRALADITIGVSLPLTGPASALGIPMKNGIALWPKKIAGEKLNVIILDDATDPTKGVQNAQALRHRRQGRHHHRLGRDAGRHRDGRRRRPKRKTVQLMLSPVALPPGKDAWTFRLPQSTAVMAHRDGRAHEEAAASRRSASSATPTPTAKAG